ncbi:hypothetical protein THSYN_02190 [Candidatus Thiodictyon syntrophicum]|uniref:Uncharacterized protein n=1 Tax=Candidatus Thiodictyon syntrophicum TaxID=1166950 RepID=A0A2K8U2S5_9GAMM|nr:hypothetical protein THSYN_02190 [Candidatus Thiodictyon syntrophicum]
MLTVLTPSPWVGLGRAGDAAQLGPPGFCADGRCYAFAQVGVLDDSGLPEAAGAADTGGATVKHRDGPVFVVPHGVVPATGARGAGHRRPRAAVSPARQVRHGRDGTAGPQ